MRDFALSPLLWCGQCETITMMMLNSYTLNEFIALKGGVFSCTTHLISSLI